MQVTDYRAKLKEVSCYLYNHHYKDSEIGEAMCTVSPKANCDKDMERLQ